MARRFVLYGPYKPIVENDQGIDKFLDINILGNFSSVTMAENIGMFQPWYQIYDSLTKEVIKEKKFIKETS
jgi:hypothetical protein